MVVKSHKIREAALLRKIRSGTVTIINGGALQCTTSKRINQALHCVDVARAYWGVGWTHLSPHQQRSELAFYVMQELEDYEEILDTVRIIHALACAEADVSP